LLHSGDEVSNPCKTIGKLRYIIEIFNVSYLEKNSVMPQGIGMNKAMP
jgi:hypothetical protein